MSRRDELKADLLSVLRDLKAEPAQPISLLEIGPPLVAKGYEQDEIVSTLFHMEELGMIALMPGNRIRLKKPLA